MTQTKLPISILSQPTRAAWIEISISAPSEKQTPCRSPLGLRGLKYFIRLAAEEKQESQPTRAAWIEIFFTNSALNCPSSRSPLGLRGLKL